MKTIYLLFALTSITILSSCYSNKKLVDVKSDGKMNVSNYRTVERDDRLDYLNFGAEAQVGHDWTINPGAKAQFGSMNSGIWSGSLNYRFKIRPNIFDNYEADKKVPALILNATYSYPIWSVKKTGTVKILLAENESLNFTAYTIDKNSPFYRFVSLEGGVNYTSSNGESDLWVEYKRNQSNQAINFADGFPDGNAIINQASISGYVGVRLSQFINTCISGKAESTSFKGVKKELWDIRFGLKPLIFAFAPDINYTYNIYENFETTSHQEYAQVNDFIQKSWLGHSIGISFTSYWDSIANRSWTYFAEWGVTPGYKEKYFDTRYTRIGLKLGFTSHGKR